MGFTGVVEVFGLRSNKLIHTITDVKAPARLPDQPEHLDLFTHPGPHDDIALRVDRHDMWGKHFARLT
jgi:hypothetical protein